MFGNFEGLIGKELGIKNKTSGTVEARGRLESVFIAPAEGHHCLVFFIVVDKNGFLKQIPFLPNKFDFEVTGVKDELDHARSLNNRDKNEKIYLGDGCR